MNNWINLLLFNYSYYFKSLKPLNAPLLVNLELTNLCNLRCPICPVSQNYKDPNVKKGMMSLEFLDKILPELKKIKPRVSINLGGESMLHPELIIIIKKLKAIGLFVFIDTNGTKLSSSIGKELLETGIDEIVLCLDGYSKDTYEEIRKGANFKDVVNNYLQFLKNWHIYKMTNKAPKVIIKNIQLYSAGQDEKFPEEYKNIFSTYPPNEYRFTWADYWPGRHRKNLKLKYEAEPIYDSFSPCVNLWKMIPISWDGKIYICCLDLDRTTYIGDLNTSSIIEVWYSSVLKGLRKKHAEGNQSQISLCQNCNQIRRNPVKKDLGLFNASETRFTHWKKEKI